MPDTAAWLVRIAARRRRDGTRGALARRALRRLVSAAGHDEPGAREAIWQLWLRGPDDDVWSYLARWRTPSFLFRMLFDAATDPRRPAASRLAIGAFCARHELAPANPVHRALFAVLTGRIRQCRALDPDGALLAAAYRGADDATRAEVRRTLAGGGDLGTVRALVGMDRPGHIPTGVEIDDLASRLADRRDWEGLWRLVRDAPLAPAVAAMRLFTGWQPPDDAGRRLFQRLMAARPERIAAAHARLPTITTTAVPIAGDVASVSFAPDGSRVAVAVDSGPYPGRRIVDAVITLPGGQLVSRHQSRRRATLDVLHLGAAILSAERPRSALVSSLGPRRGGDDHLVLRAGRRRAILWTGDQFWCMARTPDGFVAKVAEDLAFGSTEATTLRRVPLRDLLPAGNVPHSATPPMMHTTALLAVEPVTGRLAIAAASAYGFRVVGPDLAPVARTLPTGGRHLVHRALFVGADRLITSGMAPPDLEEHQDLRVWRRDGEALVTEARRSMPYAVSRDLVALPASGQVALIDRVESMVTYVDAETLADTDPPRHLADRPVHRLWSSDSGGHVAVQAEPGAPIEVRDMRLLGVADLIRRPMSGMQPADLAALSAARHHVDRAVAELVGLLCACLEHRFGTEISLGSSRPSSGDPHGVALSPPDGRS